MLDAALDRRKGWFSFGTDQCRLVLQRPVYSDKTVALRNNPAVNLFIHNETLTIEAHEAWLARQDQSGAALNFVVLLRDVFAGTVSLLRGAEPGKIEIGRFVLEANSARAYAGAVDFLLLSYSFDLLGLSEVWCVVGNDAPHIVAFRESGGWRRATQYDRPNAETPGVTMLGFSLSAGDWPAAAAEMQPMVERLLRSR